MELQKNAINPHFKNTYISLDALLEAVLPELKRVGVLLIQTPSAIGSDPALTTRLIHVASGEELVETMPLMLAKDDPQGQGSAITYARRYALMSTLGLVADEDTDAQDVKPKAKVQSVGEAGEGDTSAVPSFL